MNHTLLPYDVLHLSSSLQRVACLTFWPVAHCLPGWLIVTNILPTWGDLFPWFGTPLTSFPSLIESFVLEISQGRLSLTMELLGMCLRCGILNLSMLMQVGVLAHAILYSLFDYHHLPRDQGFPPIIFFVGCFYSTHPCCSLCSRSLLDLSSKGISFHPTLESHVLGLSVFLLVVSQHHHLDSTFPSSRPYLWWSTLSHRHSSSSRWHSSSNLVALCPFSLNHHIIFGNMATFLGVFFSCTMLNVSEFQEFLQESVVWRLVIAASLPSKWSNYPY